MDRWLGFESGEGRVVLGAWRRSEEEISVNREDGGASPGGMMMMMMIVMIARFIEHLLFSRQSSKHLTCFTLLCFLKNYPTR